MNTVNSKIPQSKPPVNTPDSITDNTHLSLTPLKLHTLGYSVIPSGGGPSGKAPIIAANHCDFKEAITILEKR